MGIVQLRSGNNSISSKLIKKINKIDNELKMILLSGLVGIVGGFGAIVFRLMISFVHYLLVEFPNKLLGSSNNLLIVIFAPAVGGLLVGSIVYFLGEEAKGHGVPEIINAVNKQKGRMRIRVPFIKILASALTIGSGGSAGREGPIAQIGGGFGSLVSKYFQLNEEDSKTLVIAGVSAGISATFNAPIGGVLFGLEVIRRDNKSFPVLSLIMSSVVSTSIASYFLGTDRAFIFPTDLAYKDVELIPFFIILGILMGLISVFWVKSFYFIEEIIGKIPLMPILLAGLGGLLLGLMEVKYPEVSGISYDPINNALALEYGLQFLLLLGLLKLIATAITLGSGGSGGIFAPTLFMGVMFGAVFGFGLIELGVEISSVSTFALLGMAALFAGASFAPLTAIIMTSEMVNDFQLFIPLMFAVSSAWIVSKQLGGDDIYTLKLKKRGISFSQEYDFLEDVFVSEIMIKEIITVSPKDRIEQVISLMKETGHTGYPVVENNHLYGIITEHDVDKAIDSLDPKDWIVSEVFTKEVISVIQNCSVSKALMKMVDSKINRFPVIESKKSHRLVGWITRSDLLESYRSLKTKMIHEEYEEELFAKFDDVDI